MSLLLLGLLKTESLPNDYDLFKVKYCGRCCNGDVIAFVYVRFRTRLEKNI